MNRRRKLLRVEPQKKQPTRYYGEEEKRCCTYDRARDECWFAYRVFFDTRRGILKPAQTNSLPFDSLVDRLSTTPTLTLLTAKPTKTIFEKASTFGAHLAHLYVGL